MLCDEKGHVAICDRCGQIHSPYWSAMKSAAMHRKGTSGHVVKVWEAGDYLTLVQQQAAAEYGRLAQHA